MIQRWVRFLDGNAVRFGLLDDDVIHVHEGDMFSNSTPTNSKVALADVKLLAPTQPSKIIALWNNFRALGQKLNLAIPAEPLYLIISPNSNLNPGETIRKPSQEGKIVYEGELGIVIGMTCKEISEEDASDYFFVFSCAFVVSFFVFF